VGEEKILRQMATSFPVISWKDLLSRLNALNIPSMIRYIRESWEMASLGSKVFAALFVVISIAGLAGTFWITSNWSGDIMEGDAEVAGKGGFNLRQSIREAQAIDPVVLPVGVAERAVLDQHFKALGGIQTVSSVSSLRFSGKVYFADGTIQDVFVVKKGGDRMRISVRTPVSQTSICISPDDNWRATWQLERVIDVEDLSPDDMESHGRYIYAVSELYLALENGWDLNYLGQHEFNYRMAHVFEVKPHPRHSVRFFIDPESFLDVGREDRIFEADGTLNITQRFNSEHIKANRLTIPGKVETFYNGELSQTLHILRGEVNSGVLDSVFTRPVLTQ